MPTVNVDVAALWKLIGKEFADDKFEDLCFEFGIELEEIVEDQGSKVYKIDIPANRYDMLCVEGIARAVSTFIGLNSPPVFRVLVPKQMITITVDESTSQIREFVVCAILRDIRFDQLQYNGFIDLQDKLHNNICRKRTLVAIGTHDLDKIKPPFTYQTKYPKDIVFTPLNQELEMNADQLMEFYSTDRKLSKFLHIIKDAPKYPVIYDANNKVLSLPPIINSDYSKISLKTKNIFIECTGTDLTKAKTVLNTIVTMYSSYCKLPFTYSILISVEPVKTIYSSGKSAVYPDLANREMVAEIAYINSCIGISESPQQMIKLIEKMSLTASLKSGSTDELIVSVPPTRSDILHQCDIMEDVAIAYNINKIIETSPKSSTVAVPLPINKLSDQLRKHFAFAGFTECSHDENFKFMGLDDCDEAVTLANPKTIEYQVVRTSLLPGLLKTISANKHLPLPLRIFEVSDIVLRDENVERRARNQRNASVLVCDTTSGFEIIHGFLDIFMISLGVPRGAGGYSIQECDHPTFFPGRRADIIVKGVVVGKFGVVHPDVLSAFDIGFPCSALEINVEHFL